MNQLIKQLSQWDIGLLRFIHQQRIESFDGLLSVCSWLTTYVSFAVMVAVFLLSLQRKSKELRLKSFKLLSVFTVSALISFLIKNIFFRERPFISYPDIQKLSEAGSSSFPSGHTMEVFAMACGIALLFPQRKYVLPAYVWAFLIAYSRMALGVHYPFDVLGGMVLGTLVGVGVVWGWGEWGIRGLGDGGTEIKVITMNKIIKNIIGVLAGLVGGSIVNMGIIMMSASIIPPPAGADVTTTEGLQASMHLFKPINFMMPFLAHALGTLAGALLAALIAANNKLIFAMVIGVFFLVGGIASVFMLPSPMWFTVVDLVGAYLPMAFLGWKIAWK